MKRGMLSIPIISALTVGAIAAAVAQPGPSPATAVKSTLAPVKKAKPVAAPPAAAPSQPAEASTPQDEARRAQVISTFAGGKVTVGDVEDEIAGQSPLMRERYLMPDQRQLLLAKMVRSELLAKEAEKRGFGRDPEVAETVKQNAAQELVREQFDAKITPESVPQEEVQKYYDEHIAEFVRPEMRRVNHILVATAKEAQDLINRLKTADLKEFRKAARERSIDQTTKLRAGDLGYIDKEGKSGVGDEKQPAVGPAVVKAAFSLAKVGDMAAAPVKTAAGFSVVKMTGQRPGSSRTVKDADMTIRKRIARARHEKALGDFVAQLRSRVKPEVHPELIEAIELEAGPPGKELLPGFPQPPARKPHRNKK